MSYVIGVDAAVVLEELSAAARAVSIAQARLMSAMVATAEVTPVEEFAPMEIASALTWTRQAATAQLFLAQEIVRRLPAVHASLANGDIDLPKARVIVDAVSILDVGIARHVCDLILPEAPGLTTGKLRARLARLVIEADPSAAAARHKLRVASRRFVLEPEQDGCANLLGLDLPASQARAAANRINALARLGKIFGDERSMDQLRADTFLRLLNGPPESGRGGSVELTASLQTLARLTDAPGDLAGYGPVIADIARQVAEQQRQATWTYTIQDPETGEVFHGTTRRRRADSEVVHGSTHRQAASEVLHGANRQNPAAGEVIHGSTRGSLAATSTMDGGETANAARRRIRGEDAGAGKAAGTEVAQSAMRRSPAAAIVRVVRARDRTCRAPGCRVPAVRCDLDHTHDWARGGATEPCNLVPLCRWHHRARHVGGWRYWRDRLGNYLWRSPLGRIYQVYPEPPP